MISFRAWLQMREMLSPVPFPSVTNMSPEVGFKLKMYTAFHTDEPKMSRRRLKALKKGSKDGDWR